MALVDLIDILKVVYNKDSQIISIFGDVEFLTEIMEDITDTILDFYGIPQDGSVEKGKKAYCRDGWYDLLWGDFCSEKISKEDLLNVLRRGQEKELKKNAGDIKNDALALGVLATALDAGFNATKKQTTQADYALANLLKRSIRGSMRITEHFLAHEFTVSKKRPDLARKIVLDGIDILKIFYLCNSILEPARAIDNKRLTMLSGKRSPELNKAIKGADNSDHLFKDFSCAGDFTTYYRRDRDKLFGIYYFISEQCSYSVGEVILYLTKAWKPIFIHISLPTQKHYQEFLFDYNGGEEFGPIDSLPDSVTLQLYLDSSKKKVRR